MSGFRYRRRVRLAPGISMNLPKSGPSLSSVDVAFIRHNYAETTPTQARPERRQSTKAWRRWHRHEPLLNRLLEALLDASQQLSTSRGFEREPFAGNYVWLPVRHRDPLAFHRRRTAAQGGCILSRTSGVPLGP
jgi:hypothetical protein